MSTAPTCLQCGKALRENKGWVDRAATPVERETFARIRAEHRAISDAARPEWEKENIGLEEWNKRSSKLSRAEDAALRAALGDVTVHMAGTAVVNAPNGQFGYEGNGRFCTLRCGYAFGTLAAIAGYRRKH